MKTQLITRLGTIVVTALFTGVTGCESTPAVSQSGGGSAATPAPPTVSLDGRRLTLDSAAAASFTAVAAVKRDFETTLRLPARVSAAAINSADLNSPLLLFETPELSQLYAEYNRSRIDLARTRKIAERLRGLVEAGAAAGKDLDDAEVDAQQADSRVREFEAKLRESGLDPNVLARLRPGTALVAADLPENKLVLVRVGLRANVDLTSLSGDGRRGDVIAVSDAIDPQTRTARMSILIPNPGSTVRPGMFASAEVTQRSVPAVAVPLTALVQADGRTYVFVRRSAREFERHEVVVGPADGITTAVLLGVSAGDQVVNHNALLLKGLFFGY